MTHQVTLIPGDGIGPEVTTAARRVIDASGASIHWDEQPLGGDTDPLPDATLASLRRTRVGLKGPVTTRIDGGPSANVGLRRALDLFAQARPARSWAGVPCVHPDVDLVVVRETTEDLYRGIEFPAGAPDTEDLLSWLAARGIDIDPGSAVSLKPASEAATARAVAVAAALAASRRGRLTIVHKATAMRATDGLFLRTARRVAEAHGGLDVDAIAVDLAAAELARRPTGFDVLVMPNMYGDILSDLAAAVTGGVGLAPGVNVGDGIAVFEPAHGSAPRHAGRRRADPLATILSGVLLLRHVGEHAAAGRVEGAVAALLVEGRTTTYDLRPPGDTHAASTDEVADALVAALA